ncbi:ornithine carbamoyltransferase [Lacrimispora defluvii]|uniref:Peptide transporter n=1 Tax=Lacrimispora defluvii TaxID=2719233 RepID=A0ABX1VMW4_9FIRM|nr:peptide transporter [Lacrimispora defluvii]NNJ29235.1 peptide transporter [Lacrimispora defluvii]
MRNLIRLNDFSRDDVLRIFQIADDVLLGKYKKYLEGKTIVMFFPASSIRTRVTFEKGIHLLGGQSILFAPETLNKKEDIRDVIGYLNNWADGLIVRHKDIGLLDKIADYARVPVINGMTDINHPCEMMADMYALSKNRRDFTTDEFLFAGAAGNIGYAWKEASDLMGFSLVQCCPNGYEIEGLQTYNDLYDAISDKDIICTDSVISDNLEEFRHYQVTLELMKRAKKDAILNPCPPFYRGEEVSDEVINSPYFAGYDFKKCLMEIQQAIVIFCMQEEMKGV